MSHVCCVMNVAASPPSYRKRLEFMRRYCEPDGCLDSLEATERVLAGVRDVEETVISHCQLASFIKP